MSSGELAAFELMEYVSFFTFLLALSMLFELLLMRRLEPPTESCPFGTKSVAICMPLAFSCSLQWPSELKLCRGLELFMEVPIDFSRKKKKKRIREFQP